MRQASRNGPPLSTPKATSPTAIIADPKGMGCGLSGWKENIPFDVDGRTCAAIIFARKGETLFDRAWIDGHRLPFAAFPVKWSNRSPNDRPQSPLETVYYRTSYQA